MHATELERARGYVAKAGAFLRREPNRAKRTPSVVGCAKLMSSSGAGTGNGSGLLMQIGAEIAPPSPLVVSTGSQRVHIVSHFG